MIAGARAALDRAPMYRVVSLSLTVLTVVAFVASLAGWLYYSPLELLALLAVVLVVMIAVARISALVWRVDSHTESSVITALLLFFILKPGLETGDLLAAAFGAAVAAVSKFVITWRDRHILNPAAVGAFAVTASGIGASYWWIGSSSLIWAVLPIALVVVIRLRQILLAAVAVAAGLAVFAIGAVTWGSSIADALQTGMLSTAIVFFAAFMVTEPLTLPPRRWQRLLVALLAGSLFAAPLALGPFVMSPQLALIAANLLGFGFGQRRAIELALRERRQSADGTLELVLDTAVPLRFRPGQAIELHVPGLGLRARGGSRRVFSLVSAPADGREVRVAFTLPQQPSAAKQRLAGLPPGSVLTATGIAGDFVLPPASDDVVLVAAGVGVTPFISWLREAKAEGRGATPVLVLAVPDPGVSHFRAELAELPVQVIWVSRIEPTELGANEAWGGPERLDGARMAELVPDLAWRDAYISGGPGFVTGMRRGLRRRAHRVRTDVFAGY